MLRKSSTDHIEDGFPLLSYHSIFFPLNIRKIYNYFIYLSSLCFPPKIGKIPSELVPFYALFSVISLETVAVLGHIAFAQSVWDEDGYQSVKATMDAITDKPIN